MEGPIVALHNGTWVSLVIDDPRFTEALQRSDLSRYKGRELVVLVNERYRLVGLAAGPAEVPRRIDLVYGAVRIEDGSAVEIPGELPQPRWLLFRCEIRRIR